MPAGMRGDPRVIRIGAGVVGEEESGCASFAAVKVRPGIQPRVRHTLPKPTLETFGLSPVMAVLDRIEFHGWAVDSALADMGSSHKPLHPGLARFAQRAVRAYLSGEEGDLSPVQDHWVAQRITRSIWELYAWGRRYESPDGALREFRFLRYGEAGSRARDPAQIAIAAFSAAFGVAAPWPDPWAEPFQLRAATVVNRVRIIDVGLLDGSRVVSFDGTPDQAEAYFADHGRAQVARIAAGGRPRPGASCVQCKLLTACDELPRIPGLLGLPGRRAPLRMVSVSDLRYYRACPAQAHLRSLNLPRSHEYSLEAELGHAVHGWLETRHTGDSPIACRPCDMPLDEQAWSGGRWRMTGETAHLGVRMLAHHPDVCPLQDSDGIADVRLEPSLVFHDTAAHAVVIAKPDMLYLQDGSWVWREVKTTQKPRWFHDDLLEEFPQLALAVVLLAEGAFGGDGAGARVELEVLRPEGADIMLIDPTDPERVATARAMVRRLAQPWRDDEVFEARPGRDCQWCPVSQWCPSFPGAATLDDPGGC